MAITPNVFAFRTRFPEFSNITEGTLSTFIEFVKTQLDDTIWTIGNDYALGVLYFTAHLASKYAQMQIQAGATDAVSGGSISSDLFVQSISFGERSVSFGRRGDSDSKVGSLGLGERGLDDTIYGQFFLSLRARNVMPIAIV